MEIYLRKRAIRLIRLSAHDAIEEGDTDTLREDIMESFKDDDIEEIERRIDSGEFYEFVSDILEEWAGDEVDDLFEILEQSLSDVGVEIKYNDPEYDDEDEEPENEEPENEEPEVEEPEVEEPKEEG